MSGRDSGRGGDRRGGFGDRDRDRDRDRPRGGFRDRDRPPGGGFRGNPRPWERRDDDDRPARPSGDRPFDRPSDRPNRDDSIRTERYYEEPDRPPRDQRPPRSSPFGGDRERDRGYDSGPPRGDRPGPPRRDTPPAGGPPSGARPRPPEPEFGRQDAGAARPPANAPATEPGLPPFLAAAAAGQQWTYHHLSDSWRDEERLRGWTPSDQDLQEMVEDNVEADPQLNARDRRNIQVEARGGVVTLTGAVRSRLAKFAAGSDAYWTYGVQEAAGTTAAPASAPSAASVAPASTASTASAAPAAPAGEDTAVTAPETPPETPPKRAARRKAAATTEASDTVEAGEPAATGGDSADSGQPAFSPPRKSPRARAPKEGAIEPPGDGPGLGVQPAGTSDDAE